MQITRSSSVSKRNKELITVILILSLLITGNYSWGYIYRYAVSVVFFARCGFRLKKLFRNVFAFYLIPNIAILIHSFCGILVYNETFHIMRSINNFGLISSIIIMTYSIYTIHKEKAINLILISIVLFFTVRIIEAAFNVGIVAFFQNIVIPGSSTLSKWLELHDVGLSLGMVIIYYMFFEKHKHINIKRIILLLFMFYVCYKRIAIGAFAAVFLFIILSNKMIDKRDKLMSIWGIVGVLLCLTVVYFIRDERLTTWLWSRGINVMGRDNLYRFFRPYYSFSPSYFGRGSGFTSKLLTSGISIIGDGSINSVAALHSDILRSFIEYGFVGSIVWYAYYLIFLPRKFTNMCRKFGEAFFALTIYAFIIYITDNTSDYLLFQMLYMLIPVCVLGTEKNSMIQINEILARGKY